MRAVDTPSRSAQLDTVQLPGVGQTGWWIVSVHNGLFCVKAPRCRSVLALWERVFWPLRGITRSGRRALNEK